MDQTSTAEHPHSEQDSPPSLERARAFSPDRESMFKVGEAIAEQIWREQQLTSARMTWNLTFQGFLIAAFALSLSTGLPGLAQSVSSIPQPIYKFGFQVIVGITGSIVALAGGISILASEKQRDYLRDSWHKLYHQYDAYSYPRPFSEKNVSKQGRKFARYIPFIFVLMWFALIGLVSAARLGLL